MDAFANSVSLGNDTSLCSGNSITLTSGAFASNTYTWNDSSHNDSLLITNGGQYSVVVTNTNNCIAKDTINVTILGYAPISNFSMTAGCKNRAVAFTDLSIPHFGETISNYNWDFGDSSSGIPNNSSTLSNPFHAFSDTGTYTIKLKVKSSAGCEQSISKTIHVAPTPTVNFTNGISCQNDSTSFSSQSISAISYSNTSFYWNFGDAASGIANSSNLATPKHLFSSQTSYPVKLVVTNIAGCKDSITMPITVKAEVKADFTYSSPCVNSPTIFQDNSIVPSPSSSQIRSWNFGGNTLNGITVQKTYTNTGVYSVTLTVTGTNGCSSKITKLITIYLPPTANFSVSSFCSKDTLQISNTSSAQSGALLSYDWKLNNTMFSSVQNPTLTSSSAATYSVKLTVKNSFTCKDSVAKSLTVFPLPIVDFTTNPLSYYYINSPVTFSPSISNANSYFWNFSSFPSSSLQNPIINFTTGGLYTVSLALQDNQGCKNSKTKILFVTKQYLDMAVLNVNTLKDADGYMTVITDVVNYGSVPITTFDIHYKISDAGNNKETWNGVLNPNSFYTYTFVSKSSSQKTTSNNITCVEIETVNGVIDENTANNALCNSLNTSEISVANPLPNPTEGDITLPITLNKDLDISIIIYNSLGQIQREELTQKGLSGLNFITLPAASYARGNYIIKITIDGKLFIKKFIVVRNE